MSPVIVKPKKKLLSEISWHVRSNAWHPPTDVHETEENVVVKMEIAGMRDEDFEVAVQANRLWISGSRSDSTERKAYHQMEIPFGKFAIEIEIPVPVEIEDATAEYKDGFLVITFPKSRLAGDITTDAPPPESTGKKKKKRPKS